MGAAGHTTIDRPDLVAWEVAGTSNVPADTPQPSVETIIDAIATLGTGQRLVLSGIADLAKPDLETIVERAIAHDLDLLLTPKDPRQIDRSQVRAIAPGLEGVWLGLDGPDRETHDRHHGASGRFDAAIRLGRWAEAAGLTVAVTTSVNTATIDQLDHLASRVLALGAKRWVISVEVPSHDGVSRQGIYPNEAEGLLEWLADLEDKSALDVVVAQAPMFERIVRMEETADRSSSTLVAGESMLFVGPDGIVSPAASMDIEIGRLPDSDLDTLYREHPLLQALRDRTNRSGKCGICEFNEVCGGGRARAYALLGDPLAQDPLCPFVPTVIRGER